MSLQTDFYTLINGIFTGQLYPSVAPLGVAVPYATYSRISAIEQSTLDTNGGYGNPVNTRLQIDIWSTSYGDCQTKSIAVKSALKGWATENVILSEVEDYESDTLLHRVMLDISIWHY